MIPESMKKNNFFIIFYFVLISLSCEAMDTNSKIVEIKNFTELKNEINQAIEQTNENKNILVIWDIDNVLVSNAHDFKIREQLKNRHPDNTQIHSQLYSFIARDPGSQPLMDEGMPEYISELKKKFNVKIICLTNSTIGSAYKYEPFEDCRIRILKNLDLNFSGEFPKYGDYISYTPPKKNSATTTEKSFIFKKGILFTNRFSKAVVLEAFLHGLSEKIKWQPDGRIIFIDDYKGNLVSVKALLEKKKIKYTLIHDRRFFVQISSFSPDDIYKLEESSKNLIKNAEKKLELIDKQTKTK